MFAAVSFIGPSLWAAPRLGHALCQVLGALRMCAPFSLRTPRLQLAIVLGSVLSSRKFLFYDGMACSRDASGRFRPARSVNCGATRRAGVVVRTLPTACHKR